MKARPGSLDEEWLDGEANIPIEDELVQIDLPNIGYGELASLMGRAAGEIRALRLNEKLLRRRVNELHSELEQHDEKLLEDFQ